MSFLTTVCDYFLIFAIQQLFLFSTLIWLCDYNIPQHSPCRSGLHKFVLLTPVCLVKQVLRRCISSLSKYAGCVNVIPYAWTCQEKKKKRFQYVSHRKHHPEFRLMIQCFFFHINMNYLILTTIIFMLHLHAHKGILLKILIHQSVSILLSQSSQNNLSLSLFFSCSSVIL